ncbi:dynamin family protein [Nonomuraea endophytica]|uniref:Putative GTPase n=1 Tax=Nonomuraea endophytica TaxID=714136 RepID=A0A7W8ABV3_9ACTN|nr:dynamin family protein [Nonomuraea endophytica]MBB5083287.1 putative GTPase [Nonomuraea endophytica]
MSHEELAGVRAEVLALHERLVAGMELTEALRAKLEESVQRVQSGTYQVVVMGEFSRGKSSLINALLGRGRLLPVNSAVTTCVVTVLRWGSREAAYVQDSSGERREIPLGELDRHVADEKNVDHLVTVETPAELLRDGLVLIDTPGIGGVNNAHTDATYASLSRADAILYVGSSEETLSVNELAHVEKAFAACPVVVTAITKAESVFDPDLEVGAARRKIAAMTGRPPEDLVVLPVSAHRRLRALQQGRAESPGETGLPELERQLRDRLAATCGAGYLERALDLLDEVRAAAEAPVTNELAALEAGEELERIATELRRNRRRAEELLASRAVWREALVASFDAAAAPVAERLAARNLAIRDRFLGHIHSRAVVDDAGGLINATTRALADALDTARADLQAAVDRAGEETTAATLLPIGVLNAEVPGYQPRLDVPDIMLRKHAREGRLSSVNSGVTVAGAVGTAIFTGAGALLPGIGIAIGAVAAVALGALGVMAGLQEHRHRVLTQVKLERSAQFSQAVLPMVERNAAKAEKDLAEAVEDCKALLLEHFDDVLRQTRDALDRSIERLAVLREASARDRKRRMAELTITVGQYERVREELTAARERVRRLGH